MPWLQLVSLPLLLVFRLSRLWLLSFVFLLGIFWFASTCLVFPMACCFRDVLTDRHYAKFEFKFWETDNCSTSTMYCHFVVRAVRASSCICLRDVGVEAVQMSVRDGVKPSKVSHTSMPNKFIIWVVEYGNSVNSEVTATKFLDVYRSCSSVEAAFQRHKTLHGWTIASIGQTSLDEKRFFVRGMFSKRWKFTRSYEVPMHQFSQLLVCSILGASAPLYCQCSFGRCINSESLCLCKVACIQDRL